MEPPIGICCTLENAQAALEAGFDYVEIGAGTLETYLSLGRRMAVEATNLFFPPTMRLTGSGRSPISDYVRSTIQNGAAAGVKVMVVGSGPVRKTYDDVPASAGFESFLRVIEFAHAVAAPLGVIIAPEALNRLETNVGNDTPGLASALAGIGVAYTLDTYHVLVETTGQVVDWDQQIPILPAHVHWAGLVRDPDSIRDEALAGAWQRLRVLGYQGRVSFEGNCEISDYPAILKTLRSQLL